MKLGLFMFAWACAAGVFASSPGAAERTTDAAASDDIHWVLAVRIKEGKEDQFEELMPEMIAATEAEEGTKIYEWLRHDDLVHLYERYHDSDAALVHMMNFGEEFADRFVDVFEIESFSVYGPASEEVRSAASDFHPVHFERVGGFAR